MICKTCGNEFDKEYFDVCPFCLAPLDNDDDFSDNEVFKEESKNEERILDNISETNEKISGEIIGVESKCEELDYNNPKEVDKVDNVVQQIFLLQADGLSVRAKNVLERNNIRTFNELMEFKKNNRISDLRGAGVRVEKEVSAFIVKVCHGEYGECYKINKSRQEKIKSLEEMVICIIQNGEQSNIHIDRIVGMSARAYNICHKNLANDMLSIAMLLKDNKVKKISGMGNKVKKELYEILEKFLNGDYFIEKNEIDKTLLLENVLENASETRAYNFFLRRAKGETLQEIGENPVSSGHETITRERVRQIEGKFYKKNKQIVEDTISAIWGLSNYFNAQEIRDLYSNKDFGIILVAILKESSEYTYLDFADIFVKNEIYGDIENKIYEIVDDFVGDGIDLYENIDEIDDIFRSKGIDFMGLDEIISFMINAGYRFYGDYVTHGRVSYAVLCLEIIKEKYPQGIKLNQDNDNPCEELQILRSLVKKRFGDIGLPEKDRALTARLSDYLVICDRGKAIPKENVQIEFSLVDDIKKFIDKYSEDKIYYSEIFANFEGVLLMTSNVNNYYFLHGVLMMYYPDDYEYHRDYLIRKGSKSKIENIADRIRRYICEMNRPVTRKELRVKFPGFTNIMIDLQFDKNPYLVQREYNLYYTMDFYTYDDEDINKLTKIINASLDQNRGFSSENILYDDVDAEMKEFLVRNKMTSPMHLFYFCSKKLGDKYMFRHPNIGRYGIVEVLSMSNIGHYLLNNPDRISYTEFCKIGDRMKWTGTSLLNAFFHLVRGYFRIDDDNYLNGIIFNISEETIQNVRHYLLSELQEKDYISLLDFNDFSELPAMEYEWNTYIFESIIKKYIPDFKIITQECKDKRYHRAFIVKDESNIKSYSELVALEFKKNGYQSLSTGKFLSFLVVNGLANATIPKEIETSGYFKIQKEYYILNF